MNGKLPPPVFSGLDGEFHFTLDTAATDQNAKCAAYYTKEQDGLLQPWVGRVWCNPPYGRQIGKWVARARQAAMSGEAEIVVMLLPARTDTRWWHDYIWDERTHQPRPGVRVRLLRGRIKFIGTKRGSAPFPSAVVIFTKG